MNGELSGRHALVTGASRGIGRVIAAHLASHGAQISAHGRGSDFLAAVELNLVATFRLIRSVLPRMKERGGGSIITMSSAAARRRVPTRRSGTPRRRQRSSG